MPHKKKKKRIVQVDYVMKGKLNSLCLSETINDV